VVVYLAKRKGLWDSFVDFVYTDLFPQKTGNDIESSNAKVVLYGLFALVGFAILTYAITETNEKFGSNYQVVEHKEVPLNSTQKVERFQQLE